MNISTPVRFSIFLNVSEICFLIDKLKNNLLIWENNTIKSMAVSKPKVIDNIKTAKSIISELETAIKDRSI